FLPGNIWATILKPDQFTEWTYDLVNYSRCVSPFTGFDLMMWGRRDVPGELDSRKVDYFYHRFFTGELGGKDVPRELEKQFRLSERIRESLPRMAAYYDDLVSTIPDRYRLVVPGRAGEIGGLHDGRILNPDVILYQQRVNALYAAGAL